MNYLNNISFDFSDAGCLVSVLIVAVISALVAFVIKITDSKNTIYNEPNFVYFALGTFLFAILGIIDFKVVTPVIRSNYISSISSFSENKIVETKVLPNNIANYNEKDITITDSKTNLRITLNVNDKTQFINDAKGSAYIKYSEIKFIDYDKWYASKETKGKIKDMKILEAAEIHY